MINILKENWNNIKNTWKGIKSLISLKTKASSVPTVLSRENGDTITNPYDIANTFKNYFASIAETTKRSIKYSQKHFSDYLSNQSSSTIFLQPSDKEEVANIISSLNSKKASVQIVYLIEYYFFQKMKFQINWQIYSTPPSRLVFFLLYSKLQK